MNHPYTYIAAVKDRRGYIADERFSTASDSIAGICNEMLKIGKMPWMGVFHQYLNKQLLKISGWDSLPKCLFRDICHYTPRRVTTKHIKPQKGMGIATTLFK